MWGYNLEWSHFFKAAKPTPETHLFQKGHISLSFPNHSTGFRRASSYVNLEGPVSCRPPQRRLSVSGRIKLLAFLLVLLLHVVPQSHYIPSQYVHGCTSQTLKEINTRIPQSNGKCSWVLPSILCIFPTRLHFPSLYLYFKKLCLEK